MPDAVAGSAPRRCSHTRRTPAATQSRTTSAAADGGVTIDDVDVRDIPEEELRESVAIALQEAVLFTGYLPQLVLACMVPLAVAVRVASDAGAGSIIANLHCGGLRLLGSSD